MKDTTENTLAAVEKAFNIITTIQKIGPVQVTELAEYLGIPDSTAQVHLNTLKTQGYVRKEGGKYDLSLKFLDHGGYVRRRQRVYRAAKQHINSLAEEVGEAANLGVEENGQRVLVYKSEVPEGAIYDNAPTGERTHLHWTALGKALLSELPSKRVHEIIDEYGLPSKTEHTITDREALIEELEVTRERGYSIEDEDRRKGITAIGVPIMGENSNKPVGAVCVSGPRSRLWNDGIEPELVEAVQNTVNVIELQYNYYLPTES
ncbi:IclR family transcriptional regulator [Haloarcula nitratireducens]|uniref:IclR family transcriptional regulator n=1 Tax=Haloarcula nitratireducens TaxID=2487749 RepID=A0AAW4PGN0_9EURY|nr:IclR family transcriptional regulator [Halomicroarcula nitratireducens]MBX0297053.1 IclR family transcriptional regulator [Halomicroarcula nitratireducens]